MNVPVHPDSQKPRLPAEWEPHAALMMTWPHAGNGWGAALPEVEACFTGLATAAARFEPLLVVCRNGAHLASVRTRLIDAGIPADRLILAEAPSNDVWARDHGPITVIQPGGAAQLLDFQFNGWGQRYPHRDDDLVTRRLTDAGVFGAGSYRRIEWVLEGGSIDSDGAGTLLTTRRCLMHTNRNGETPQSRIEEQLAARLGAGRVLWLESGWLAGDDTDGHVDQLARFLDRETIAYATCTDPDDEHFEPLRAMAEGLAALRTLRGEPYRLVPLPLPAPQVDDEGRRLAASYVNFIFLNGGLIVPAYDDPADTVAAARLAQAVPGRTVVQVPAHPIIRQGGSLHCATMHLPAGVAIDGVAAPLPASGW